MAYGSVRGPPVGITSTRLTDDFIASQFQSYIKEFGKTFASDEEREKRLQIFIKNYRYIVEENEKGHEYTLGVNQFTDMPREEFMGKFVGLKLRDTSAPEYLVRGIHYRKKDVELPPEVDWEEKGAVTKVKDQGECGSCYSFSTTGALEGRWEIATGKLTELSEQQLVDCSQKEGNMGCNGGIMDFGFEYIHKNGLCSEADYKYDAEEESCKASSCSPVVPEGAVSGFVDVHSKDPEALMDALAEGPVSIAIQADELSFQMYHDGVLTAECGSDLNHGVLLVGYGTLNGTKYWKVKNSWGPQWGKDGYILLSRSKEGDGECGILLQASYPVVNKPAIQTINFGSSTHYGKPPECAEDEVAARLSVSGGLTNGMVCTPHCDPQGQCPTDVPFGVSAIPQCAVESPDKSRYCVLMCEAGDVDACGDAECVAVQDQIGICMYPQDGGNSFTLTTSKEEIIIQ